MYYHGCGIMVMHPLKYHVLKRGILTEKRYIFVKEPRVWFPRSDCIWDRCVCVWEREGWSYSRAHAQSRLTQKQRALYKQRGAVFVLALKHRSWVEALGVWCNPSQSVKTHEQSHWSLAHHRKKKCKKYAKRWWESKGHKVTKIHTTYTEDELSYELLSQEEKREREKGNPQFHYANHSICMSCLKLKSEDTT